MERRRVFSGAPWEKTCGYCRAVRAGATVAVAGTVALDEDGTPFAPGNPYDQTRRAFAIALQAAAELGAKVGDVVRTRMYVTDVSRWQEYARAHGEIFGEHPPATSMLGVMALIDPAFMVEVEIDAVLASAATPG